MSKVSRTESLASKLKFDDRLGRGVEIYRCVQPDHQWTDGPGMDIVQYNVILTCIVLASLYMISNSVQGHLYHCRKLSSYLGGSDIVDAH